jgi:hypothetical protein
MPGSEVSVFGTVDALVRSKSQRAVRGDYRAHLVMGPRDVFLSIARHRIQASATAALTSSIASPPPAPPRPGTPPPFADALALEGGAAAVSDERAHDTRPDPPLSERKPGTGLPVGGRPAIGSSRVELRAREEGSGDIPEGRLKESLQVELPPSTESGPPVARQASPPSKKGRGDGGLARQHRRPAGGGGPVPVPVFDRGRGHGAGGTRPGAPRRWRPLAGAGGDRSPGLRIGRRRPPVAAAAVAVQVPAAAAAAVEAPAGPGAGRKGCALGVGLSGES